jgi:hypothetical protein
MHTPLRTATIHVKEVRELPMSDLSRDQSRRIKSFRHVSKD